MKKILVFLFLIFFSHAAIAQEQKEMISKLREMSIDELMNIEIELATKKSQTINEAPAIVSVITEQQIKESGYQTVGEALNRIAGLDLLHDQYQYNLGLRGISGGMRAWSRIVKIMIDGQPTAYRPSSENFLGEELIPIDVVKKIEVIRGPASALYGANAYLGAINIITRNGSEGKWGEISGRLKNAQNLNDYGSSTVFGGKLNNLDFIAAGTFSRSDKSGSLPVNVPGSTIYGSDDKSENDISRPLSLFAKLKYETKEIGKLGLHFSYQLMDSYAEFQDWGILTHNNRISIANYFVSGKYARKFTEDFSSTFSINFSKGEPTSNEKLDTDTDNSDWITRDVGYKGFDVMTEFMYSFKERNTFTIGFDYTTDTQNLQTHYLNTIDLGGLPQQGIEYGNEKFNNTGFYSQMILYPVTSLGLTAGLRFDKHNIYEDVFNYRLAGVYQLTDKVYSKILFGTSFKAPSSVQLFSNYIIPGGVIGNPELKPEKAKTVELALGAQLTKNVNFNINGFYNMIEDKVELLLPAGNVSNVTPENIAEIASAGVESELVHSWKTLLSYINISYQKSVKEIEHLLRGKIKLNTTLFPSYMVKFGSNYKVPEYSLILNLEGSYIDKRIASQPNSFIYDPINYRTEQYELDSYFLLDFAISYDLNLFKQDNTEIKFKIYNILDKEYAYPGFRDFDIPGFKRTLNLRIIQHF